MRQAIIASWAESDAPASVVKQLIAAGRGALAAGDDPRLLGESRSRTTIASGWRGRTWRFARGQFDRAAEWLDACDAAAAARQRRLARPARTGAGDRRPRRGVARLEHLPADALDPRPICSVSAPGSPSRTDNVPAERAALTALVELEPGDTAALDRLAILAGADGDAAEVDTAAVEESPR